MRTSDFVVAMKDLKSEHPALWRITTGNNLLQQFAPKPQKGMILYENTHQYAGWNPEIKKDYVGVDVKLTQQNRNQIFVERLFLNFQKIEDAEAFYDKHFSIYLQIIISTALDPKFWESIESEPGKYLISSKCSSCATHLVGTLLMLIVLLFDFKLMNHFQTNRTP